MATVDRAQMHAEESSGTRIRLTGSAQIAISKHMSTGEGLPDSHERSSGGRVRVKNTKPVDVKGSETPQAFTPKSIWMPSCTGREVIVFTVPSVNSNVTI